MVIVGVAASCFAGTVAWENLANYVYTPGGARIPTANNWAVGIYQDTGNAGVGPWGEDTLISENKVWQSPGYVTGSFTSSGGFNAFARIFNASSISGASMFVNVGSGVHAVPTLDAVQIHNWDIGGTAPSGSDWQLIPEPGTMALFGLGLATLIARQRLSK